MLITIIVFVLLALLMTGIYAFLNEPDESWMLDPLPGLAEKGEHGTQEQEPDTEPKDHLDLEI